MTDVPSKTRVVILGGAGGAAAAKKLSRLDNLAVTLVDAKAHFELTLATPRILGQLTEEAVRAEFRRYTLPYAEIAPNATIVVDTVAAIGDKTVTLASGNRLDFDVLLVALGSLYASPWKWPVAAGGASSSQDGGSKPPASLEEREEELLRYWRQVRAAKSIFVLGGGTVGVEVAADLALANPQTHITLAHSSAELLPRCPSSMRRKAAAFFEHLSNVTLLLGERFGRKSGEDGEVQVFESPSGKTIEADLVFKTIGFTPANAPIKAGPLADAVNENGCLRVRATLQVYGHDNIFAIGDIADVDGEPSPEKMLYRSMEQAKVVIANIKGFAKDGRCPKQWSGVPLSAQIVSLGQKHSIAKLGPTTIVGWTWAGSCIAAKIKTKTFTDTMRDLRA
eukprot:m.178640 g.178640  ORF g.178640 m.178640 type:complete len:394 (+) comp10450_c0_seq7:20-1201(+)